MINYIEVDWPTIKAFVDDRSLSIQWLDLNNTYVLVAIDGYFAIKTQIVKSNTPGADQTDFETNYKANGNGVTKSNVVQVLGKDNLSLSPRTTGKITCPKTSSITVDKQLDEKLVVRGGVLYSPNATIGDKLKVQVIDKDNVLGAGGTPDAPTMLAEYVKEWSVMPNIPNELLDVSISEPLMQGLYFRFIYTSHSSATQDADLVINLIAYEGVT